MNFKQVFVSLLVPILFMTTLALAQTNDKLPPIRVTEYKLKNGLTVVLSPDKSTPIVAVNVWYHVGSKNESPGRTGFAHLFEHMMFQGAKKYSDDYLSALDELGANVNG
ncbi:MAG: M16 family metallopeptidase, partial [Pyrinomonadaceae bacterium]